MRMGLLCLLCPAACPRSGTPDHLGTHGSIQELSKRLGHFCVAPRYRCLTTQEHHPKTQHWGCEPVLNAQKCHHQPGSALQRFGLISPNPQVMATTAHRSHDFSQGCPGGYSSRPSPGQAVFQVTTGEWGWVPGARWRD